MEKIEFTLLVRQKLRDLLEVLIVEEYFSYLENADAYVDSLIDFIYTIPTQRRYVTRRKRYGHWYCRYKPNQQTTWYITFDTDETIWIVRNIINNHTREYPIYIRGTK